MKYFYKSIDEKTHLSLKEPLSDMTGYSQITEEEFNLATQLKPRVVDEAKLEARKLRQKIAELKQWFENNYRTYCEMLTRRQALGIDDKIVDQFRNKTYTNLTELYQEAEVVAKEIKALRG